MITVETAGFSASCLQRLSLLYHKHSEMEAGVRPSLNCRVATSLGSRGLSTHGPIRSDIRRLGVTALTGKGSPRLPLQSGHYVTQHQPNGKTGDKSPV